MKHIISNHNKTVLESTKVKESQGNCRDKQSCPLNGQCLQRGVVYKATVEQMPSKTQDTYIGITENEFKTRYKTRYIYLNVITRTVRLVYFSYLFPFLSFYHQCTFHALFKYILFLQSKKNKKQNITCDNPIFLFPSIFF